MPTTLRMSPELEERYAHLAVSTGRSKAFYFNRALENSIDELEYEFGILKKVEAFRAGKLQTISLDELGESLGLEDRS